MNVILISLFCMLCYGAYDFLISGPARQISGHVLIMLLSLGNLILFIIFLLVFQEPLNINAYIFLPIMVGLTGYTGVYFYSQSVKTGLVGVSSSIANAYPLITIGIGYIFLKELFIPLQFFFFACIILGIIFISFHIEEIRSFSLKKSKTSLLYAMGAMLMWAAFITLFDISVKYFHPLVSVFYSEAFLILILLLVFSRKKKTIISDLRKLSYNNSISITILIIVSAVSFLGVGYALELGQLSFVSAITACSPAITALLARIFLKEKLSNIQYVAIGVLVLGISGLSYVSL